MENEIVDLSRTSIQTGTHPQVLVHKSRFKAKECCISLLKKSLSQPVTTKYSKILKILAES
jgi:hypothetical protein